MNRERLIRVFTAVIAGLCFIQQAGAQSSPAVQTIADAIAQRGADRIVTVAGRATVSSGKLQASAFDIAIEDATGAVRLFSRVPQPDVREGDSVMATGSIQKYRGNLELMATTITVMTAPVRAIVPMDIVIDPATFEKYAGRLVRVRGRVAGSGSSEGGQYLKLRDVNSTAHGTITVWIPANHAGNIDLRRAGAADSIAATGIVTAYQDNPEDAVVWQLVPRDAHDLIFPADPIAPSSWLLWSVLALALVAGGWVVAMRVGAQRQLHQLKETEARYKQLLELLPDAVIVHADGKILFSNPFACELLGLMPNQQLVGLLLSNFVDLEALIPRTRSGLTGELDAHGMQRPPTTRVKMRTQLGGEVDVDVASSPCVYHDKQAMLLLARDITSQLRYERDLHALALVDDLTGLQNRRAFQLVAEQELARARRNGHVPMLVFADLDGLKQINDQYGHAQGDVAIKLVAGALKSIFRETDMVARWSGDEFVALMVDGTEEASQLIGARLDAAIAVQSPPRLPYVVTASVGSSALDPSLPLRDAMERADAELYAQKKRNRRSKIRMTPIGVDVVNEAE